MSNETEASEPGDWKDEPVMPIEHLLPPFRRDSPLGRHFAELDAETKTGTTAKPGSVAGDSPDAT